VGPPRDGEQVVGFAYLALFRSRAAYAQTAENSVYVAAAHRGRRIGGILLDALIARAAPAGVRSIIAVLGTRAQNPAVCEGDF
jgi:L-amino acid N-acyltransferase YncA